MYKHRSRCENNSHFERCFDRSSRLSKLTINKRNAIITQVVATNRNKLSKTQKVKFR